MQSIHKCATGWAHTVVMHVLFEDHHYIAINKPAPLMTQAPAGVPSNLRQGNRQNDSR